MINRKNITQRTAAAASPNKSRANSPVFVDTQTSVPRSPNSGSTTPNPGTISPVGSNLSTDSSSHINSSLSAPPQNQHFQTPSLTPRIVSNTAHKPRGISSSQFHPKLISAQIVAVQSIHYIILSLLIQFNHILFGTTITIDRIFTANYINVWSAEGWVDGGAILFSSVLGSLVLAIIVEKSKKCLDFAVTLFIIHLAFCTLYAGFPGSFDWWIIHVLGLIILVLFGEYLCSRIELREIPLL